MLGSIFSLFQAITGGNDWFLGYCWGGSRLPWEAALSCTKQGIYVHMDGHGFTWFYMFVSFGMLHVNTCLLFTYRGMYVHRCSQATPKFWQFVGKKGTCIEPNSCIDEGQMQSWICCAGVRSASICSDLFEHVYSIISNLCQAFPALSMGIMGLIPPIVQAMKKPST